MNYKLKLLVLSGITSLLIFIPGVVYPFISDSFIISAKPKDIWPPAAITDLTVENTTIEGQVKLIWTAPDENNNKLSVRHPVQGYYIRYATFSVASLQNNTTVWWNSAKQVQQSYAKNPGEREVLIIINKFTPGVTFYFAIKSYDDANPPNVSPIDIKTVSSNQAYVVPKDLPPGKVKNLTATYTYHGTQIDVSLSWTDLTPEEKGLNFRYYCIYRDTTPPEGPWSDYKLIGTTTSYDYFDIIDVSVNKSDKFFYRVTGKDSPPLELEGPPSEPVMVIWDIIPPSAPKGLVLTGTDRKVKLQWQKNIEQDLAGYNIYRSTYSMGYSSIPINSSLITTTSFEDTGVTNGITYYYVITAVDIYKNESNYSEEKSIMPKDNLPPKEPSGVKGILSRDETTMVIKWSPVTRNEDGTPCEDLLGYNIYRASTVDGVYTLKGFIPKDQELTWTDPENVRGQVFYYYIRAVDTSYNLSKISMIADSSRKMNIIGADVEDLSTNISIPKEISDVLYKDTNFYGDDIKIDVVRNRNEENGRIIKSVTFIPKKSQTDEIIKDFVFPKPLCEIVVSYEVENGKIKTSENKISIPEDKAEEQLSLFWFNGVEWVKLGGKVDKYFRSVGIKSERVGKYMIKQSLQATSFEIESIYPDKTFTPNGDGWNDYFEIQYANPKDGSVSGKIYDLKGVYVADMKKGKNDESLMWDGRDSQGRTVSGGVYIYQIEVSGAERKIINGTCIVAR